MPEFTAEWLRDAAARVGEMSELDVRTLLRNILGSVYYKHEDADELRAGLFDDLDNHGLLPEGPEDEEEKK